MSRSEINLFNSYPINENKSKFLLFLIFINFSKNNPYLLVRQLIRRLIKCIHN